MDAHRAVQFFKASFLCSDCGRARVKGFGWIPSEYLEPDCELLAFLCHKCAAVSSEPLVCIPVEELRVRVMSEDTDDEEDPKRQCLAGASTSANA
jgi:hypothetical protein